MNRVGDMYDAVALLVGPGDLISYHRVRGLVVRSVVRTRAGRVQLNAQQPGAGLTDAYVCHEVSAQGGQLFTGRWVIQVDRQRPVEVAPAAPRPAKSAVPVQLGLFA